MTSSHATNGREDISRFVVHLTRNNKATGGDTPRKNFMKILSEQRIRAFSAHCLHGKKVKTLDEAAQKRFAVCCFTETPLNQLHLLVGEIPGRSIELEAFGVCFNREFLIEKGAQQAIYINSYEGNTWLRECADDMFDRGIVGGKVVRPIWRMLPFINAMHEKYDFSWEREWRIRGDLKFRLADIVCVILPRTGHENLRAQFAKAGIAAISPGWTYEEIVSQLAGQQRATKRSLKKLTDG